MKIIIDAMGGDKAPGEIVRGALRAKRELGVELLLVGREEAIRACLQGESLEGVEIVDAREVITMEDDPSKATRRKKDASMTVALQLLRDGRGDAMVSAGSTGALLTGATLIVKRIRGIRRAAMAPVLPAGEHGVMLVDCGANVECTAEYLLQFAFMGSFYASRIMGCDKPRVGLVNVGTEETKGGALQHEAYALLKAAHEQGRIHFVGNVEGTQLFNGSVDVAVCDGYTGNVLLKTTEGVIRYIMGALKGVLTQSTKNKLAAALLKSDLGAMKRSMDPNEVGGTAFIGISKPVIKAHGGSDAGSFFSAIRQAVQFAGSGMIACIEENVEYMKIESEHEGTGT